MKTDLYFEYCVAMSYKTWPLKSAMDLMVLNVVESGIQRYWEFEVFSFIITDRKLFISRSLVLSQSTVKYSNSKLQLSIARSRHIDYSGPASLDVEHMVGIFFVWGVGICISLLGFVVELIIARCCKKGKVAPRRNQHQKRVWQ